MLNRKKIDKLIKKSALLNKILSKSLFFNLKYSNYFLNNYEYIMKKDYLHSYPTIISLNSTNVCNYRCLFCEIHYFHDYAKKTTGKIFANNLNVKFIKKFENLFNKTMSIDLTAATGDALVNPNFIDLSTKLKEKKIQITVTTNGALLNQNIAEKLINMKFDHVMVSLHSGEEQNYRELHGGNFNTVIANIEYLIKFRRKKHTNLPRVSINCLIFQLNIHTIKKLMKKMAELDIDEMYITQYYGSRNKISHEFSFYFNPEEGNKWLKEIYNNANNLKLKLIPETPKFIEIDKIEGNLNNNHICNAPWSTLKLKGCVEYENSHYVGICNRIILFRLNYEDFDGDFLKDIWNHEIVLYMRKTVMKNPICQFCKNPNTPKIRCINNKLYQITRDKAIKDFFNEFFKNVKVKARKGIYLLKEFPYKYIDYYDRN